MQLSQADNQFLRDQTQTPEGLRWFGLLQKIIDDLYYSKGVSMEEIIPRQKAAQALESILFKAQSKQPEPTGKKKDYI